MNEIFHFIPKQIYLEQVEGVNCMQCFKTQFVQVKISCNDVAFWTTSVTFFQLVLKTKIQDCLPHKPLSRLESSKANLLMLLCTSLH